MFARVGVLLHKDYTHLVVGLGSIRHQAHHAIDQDDEEQPAGDCQRKPPGTCPGEPELAGDQPPRDAGLNGNQHKADSENPGQIGNLMWNWRMLAITGEARFAEVMERTLYNSILSGIEVDGEGWSYTNPLRWHGSEHVLRSNDTHKRSYPGTRMICCPTNLMRTVASWHNYLYSVDERGLWIHHYGGNVFDDYGSWPQDLARPHDSQIQLVSGVVATRRVV